MATSPLQIVKLFPALATGSGLTMTLTVPVAVHPLALVTVTVYVPDAAGVALGMEGFCKALEKEFGPDHE